MADGDEVDLGGLRLRLASMNDDVRDWPTHGAGSFCSAPPGCERTSTIRKERAGNALLAAAHVPGALSIPPRPVFGTWLGLLVGHARTVRTDIAVLDGGPEDWAETTGGSVEVGA